MPVILVPGAWELVPWLERERAWPRNGRSLADLSERDVDGELGGLVREINTLLEPCRDEPEVHLGFRENGEIHARNGSVRGQSTIEVLFLDRSRLNVARRTRIRIVCRLLERAAGLRAMGPTEQADRVEDLCTDNAAEYAGAARAVLRDPAAFGL